VITPDEVIKELQRIQRELEKASTAVYQAELRLADAEHELDTVEAFALLNADGATAQERAAKAKLDSSAARHVRDVAKAEVNRIRTKIRTLESASVATSVIAKQVELTYRNH
jgi:hypothetical protein